MKSGEIPVPTFSQVVLFLRKHTLPNLTSQAKAWVFSVVHRAVCRRTWLFFASLSFFKVPVGFLIGHSRSILPWRSVQSIVVDIFFTMWMVSGSLNKLTLYFLFKNKDALVFLNYINPSLSATGNHIPYSPISWRKIPLQRHCRNFSIFTPTTRSVTNNIIK